MVFTIGSMGWILVGLDSDQTGLVITNSVLSVINAVGVWRWLGRQARYVAVGSSAEAAGRAPPAEPVLPATGIFSGTDCSLAASGLSTLPGPGVRG